MTPSTLQRHSAAPTAKTRIVTDSTADVLPALAAELEIAIVPCRVYLSGVEYQDRVDLQPEELFERLKRTSDLPRTSQPAVADFFQTYQQLIEKDQTQKVISIHLPGNLSGTMNAAWAAAQMLPDPTRVSIIDSGQISMGMGWAVIKAGELAQMGAQADEIETAVQALLPRLRTIAMIDKLDYLVKGGRISQITALIGTTLQIKPLLSVHGGVISVLARVRSHSRAVEQLLARVRKWGPLAEIVVLHTGAEQLAHDVAAALMEQTPGAALPSPYEIKAGTASALRDGQRRYGLPVQSAGPAITCHLGLGAVGVCALLAGP